MRPHQTRTRSARLSNIFLGDPELNARLASVCVLFEDLRIEITGMSAKELETLDACGGDYRHLYFVRRSIATLHEFTNVLSDLDRLPAFGAIRARFGPLAFAQWTRALRYLAKYDKYTAKMRHHVGGHFKEQAGRLAVKDLSPDSMGSLEVSFYDTGAGEKLFFAIEIAATVAFHHVPGTTSDAKARRFIRHAKVGYRHAVRAVDCIARYHFWERMGVESEVVRYC